MFGRGIRRVGLALLAAVLGAVTLLVGVAGASTALLGRAVGPSSGAELRGSPGATLSATGTRTRVADRAGAAATLTRRTSTPRTAASRDLRPADPHLAGVAAHVPTGLAQAGGGSGPAAVLLAPPVSGAAGWLVLAGRSPSVTPVGSVGWLRAFGRAPPAVSGS